MKETAVCTDKVMEHYNFVLVVAEPGRWRDALHALLGAVPQIQVIGLADSRASALKIIQECQPSLVLLDVDLPIDSDADKEDGPWDTLGKIKKEYSQIQCLVLVDNDRQRQMARAAGADEVLLKGFLATELSETIEKLQLHPVRQVPKVKREQIKKVSGATGDQVPGTSREMALLSKQDILDSQFLKPSSWDEGSIQLNRS